MYQTAGAEYLSVQFHEACRSQSFARFLHLWVGECDPDFAHFARGEEFGKQFDRCAQESGVGQAEVARATCSGPHPCTFYVDADEVFFGEQPGQSGCVFAFPASEFEDYGSVVSEYFFTPFPAQGESAVGLQSGERVLENSVEVFHFLEFLQFVFSHLFVSGSSEFEYAV